MNIFIFLYAIGIINLAFGFAWKWIIVVPTAIFFAAVKFNHGMKVVKLLGTYLLVSMMALLTLRALGDTPGLGLIFYPLIGGYILFMSFATNRYEAQKQAIATSDWEVIRELENETGFELILMIGAVLLYVASLFIPAVVFNPLTQWLFDAIFRVLNLPVIGWLLGIGGSLFLLGMIFNGLIASAYIVGLVIQKFKGPSTPDSTEASIDLNIKSITKESDLSESHKP